MSSIESRIPPLTPESYEGLRARLGLAPSPERGSLFSVVEEVCRSVVSALEQLTTVPTAGEPRARGHRPAPTEDPLNAFVRVIDVTQDTRGIGPMSGMRVALKDNIPIAGIPMTMGCEGFRDYVPAEDAMVTRRILSAGARLVATTNMESFALSASGEMSDYGRVLNPFDPSRTVSGSSSGGAAALWYDGVDVAFGTDTGGSCRLPAAWAGVLGLKPTHGLIPYEGVPTADRRLDHIGIMSRTVDHLARALEGTASWTAVETDALGESAVHQRQSFLNTETHTELAGIRFGVVAEAFDGPETPDERGTIETLAAARASVQQFSALGADVSEVALEAIALSDGIMFAALAESVLAAFRGAPSPYQWTGGATPDFARAMSEFMTERADHLPPSAQAVLLAGLHFHENAGGGVSAAAHSMADTVRSLVDRTLNEVDFLLVPTASHLPLEALEGLEDEQKVRRGWGMSEYAGLFNFTGHPVMSLPIGQHAGLPVGVSVVGKHHSEAALLAVARAIENRFGWQPTSSMISKDLFSPEASEIDYGIVP